MNIRLILLGLICLCVGAFAAEAEKGDAAALAQALDAISSMRAEFIQINQNGMQQETLQGEVELLKPHYFFWDYQSPNKQQIISDGALIYYYDIDLEQITVRRAEELNDPIATSLLKGEKFLQKRFKVRTIAQLPAAMRAAWLSMNEANVQFQYFELLPRQEEQPYEKIFLALNEQKRPCMLILDAGSGVFTMLIFKDPLWNKNIDRNVFNFVPPAGVDVIGVASDGA